MKYKVLFHTEAKKELDSLDNSIRSIVLKQILKIQETPEIGDMLGNKAGMDLSDFRKMYAFKKKIRIVYKIINDELIVYIISIGKRDKSKVYEDSIRRKE